VSRRAVRDVEAGVGVSEAVTDPAMLQQSGSVAVDAVVLPGPTAIG
jgi:hypothetical protein